MRCLPMKPVKQKANILLKRTTHHPVITLYAWAKGRVCEAMHRLVIVALMLFCFQFAAKAIPSIVTQPFNITACTGTSATFSISATGTSLTYQWLKSGVAISGATSDTYTINSVVAGSAGSYSCRVSDGTNVTSSTATLTVVSTPAAPTTATSVNYCQFATASPLTATGASLTWGNSSNISGAGGGTGQIGGSMYIRSDNNNRPTYFSTLFSNVLLTSVDYYVPMWQTTNRLQLGLFNSSNALLAVSSTVTSQPSVGSITKVTNVFNYNIVSAGSYSIQVIGGDGLIGGDAPTFPINEATGTVRITSAPNSRCFNNFQFTRSSVTTAPTPTTSTVGTQNYRVTQTVNNCTSPAANIVVTIAAAPTTSNAGPDQTGSATCGLTTVTLAGNAPTSGTGTWSVVSGVGGTITTPTSRSSTFTGVAGNTYTLRWSISSSCATSTDDVVITFNRNPTTAIAGTNQLVCGTTATLAGNTPAIGTGTWTKVSGTGGSFSNANSPTSTFTGTAGITYILRWTIANSPCTQSTSDVTITFSTAPVVAGTSTKTCVGGSTGTITASASGGIAPYTYNINGGTYQSSATFTGLAAGTYTLNAKEANGCVGTTTVVVSSYPTASENELQEGMDSWIGHVYYGTNFNSYVGRYTEAETFNQLFGGNTTCFDVTGNGITQSIYTESFSVKYRMTSTKRGLYIVDLGSDDGSRLTVDGTLVYNNWADQGYSAKPRNLFTLTGSSSLVYEFYENAGGNQVAFQNLTLVLANTLSANTTQTFCTASMGAAISGDSYGVLPAGITLSGTGYQWTYSTTAGGLRTVIPGATGATFTPNATVAPFNTPGTYYVYRNAVLVSTNNTGITNYTATNESNAAIITITAQPTATISYSGSPYCNGSGTANVTLTGTTGGSFSAPAGLSIDATTGAINLTASAAGTYTVTYTVSAAGGCSVTTATTTIVVTEQPYAEGYYAGSPYCSNAGFVTPTVITVKGASGTLSSTAGLVFDTYGQVNLGASTPGSYTVTYTVAAQGGCAQFTYQTPIAITAAPSATISYSGTPFCSLTGTANVTRLGTPGGTYSSTAGLSIDGSTGAVNLATSTPGTYTVTYTVAAAGGCAAYSTTTIIQLSPLANNTLNFVSGANASVCATPAEGANATLTAPAGTYFSTVDFASYGTPTGTCGAFVKSTCNATNSLPVAESYTLGNTTVTIPATNGVFGDPCSGTVKKLYVQATYTQPICSGTSPGIISGSAPTGGNGVYTYLWEKSTTSATAGFSVAPGTNNARDYDPGVLSQTTWFRRTVTSNGCTDSKVILVQVTTAASATISYAGSPYCMSAGTATVILTGTSGGTYSSTTGLSINATTGQVNLGASTAGTYTVTYTIAGAGGCNAYTTATSITILPIEVLATVGTTSACYPTLKDAFDKINDGTHKGAIIIKLNGSTDEPVIASLNASGTGSATYTSVMMYPTVSGVSITGNLNSALINLNGADNVTIDGRVNATGNVKTLQIANSSTGTSASTIRFISSAENNIVRYSTIKSASTGNDDGGILFGTSGTGAGNNGNLVEFNDFTSLDDYNRPMNLICSEGTAATPNTNNTISNNNFFNYFNPALTSSGIYFMGGSTDFTISGNSFFETTSLTPTANVVYYGIRVGSSSGNNFLITNNYFGGSAPQAGGSVMTVASTTLHSYRAIDITSGIVTPSSIQGNTIANINYSSYGTSTFYGVFVNSGNVNIGTMTGNTIGATTGNGSISLHNADTASVCTSYGIYINSGGDVNVVNNKIGSIDAYGSDSISHSFIGIYKKNASGITNILNNVIGSSSTAKSINAATPSAQNKAQNVYGIQSAGNDVVTISGNTIANLNNEYLPGSSTLGTTAGILTSGSGVHIIKDNIIRDLSNTSPNSRNNQLAAVIGISDISTGDGKIITGNTIYNLYSKSATAPVSVIGIYCTASPVGNNNLVAGNFIRNLTVGSSNTAADIYGIKIEKGNATYSNNIIKLGQEVSGGYPIYGFYENGVDSNTSKIYFNTVSISGTVAATSQLTYAFYNNSNTDTRDLRNNIFSNTRSSASGSNQHYAIRIAGTNKLTIDNNNYFVNGTGGTLGRIVNANSATLDAWINAVAAVNGDSNSVSVDPVFTNPTGTNASDFTSGTIMTGVSGTGITTDYFNATRIDPPRMGAIDCSANPTVSNANPVTRCGPGTATLNATPSAGATIAWYDAPTKGNLLGTGNSFTTPVVSVNTTYYAEAVYVGCRASYRTAVPVIIATPPSATIAYTGSPYCKSGGTATVTQTGTPGGTFSSTAGLSITAANGSINLAASTPGSYTVTYTVAAAASCPVYTTTTTITITAQPNASISYTGSPFCSSVGTASVTLTGTAGGSFSGTTGLAINASTGAIDLANSTAGTHTITYTVAAANGCSVYTTTTTVTITTQPNLVAYYPGNPFCSNQGVIQPVVTSVAGAAGTYTTTPGLVFQGIGVDVGASSPGNHTITYTVPAQGGCAKYETTIPITIYTAPSATISYGSGSFCSNAGSIAVTQTGITGGTYTGTAGLSINSATGAINIAASTPGDHTITYTIPASGPCGVFTTTANLSIFAQPTITNPVSYSVCNNTPTAIDLTATAPADFSWTLGSVTGTVTGASAGSGSSINQTLVNAGATTATVDYIVTPVSKAMAYTGTLTTGNQAYTDRLGLIFTANSPIKITSLGVFDDKLDGIVGNIQVGIVRNSDGVTVAGPITINGNTDRLEGNHRVRDISPVTLPAGTYTIVSVGYSANDRNVNATIGGGAGLVMNTGGGVITYNSSSYGGAGFGLPTTPYPQNNVFHAGTFSFATGCTGPSKTITVSIAPTTTIAYGASNYCASAPNALPTVTGLQGGTFSSAAGLSLNASTGQINFATSTPGTYTVIYNIPAVGSCSGKTAVATINITATPSATISYAQPAYCSSTLGSASVNLTGTLGGVFTSSPAGLSINASTGAINFATSDSVTRTYTVTYTVAAAGGCSIFSTSTTVTITEQPYASGFYPGNPYCSSTGILYPTVSALKGPTGVVTSTAGLIIDAYGGVNLGASTPGSYTVTYTVQPTGGCGLYVTTAPITLLQAGKWVGITSSDWGTASNWECGGAPTTAINVVIPAGTPFKPVASSNNNAAKDIFIASGTSLTVTGSLQIAGAITNNGTFDAQKGTIEMKGASAQNIPANAFVNNSLKGLTINNTAGVTMQGPINLYDVLTVTSGQLTSNGYLTLKSSDTATARVATITSLSATPVVGDVNVERYIQGRRKYRLMTSSVTTSPLNVLTAGQVNRSIWGNWQSAGDTTQAGKGTLITGGTVADGFDPGTSNPSLYTYDAVNRKYIGYTSAAGNNTKFTPLKAGIPYYMFIYGDRKNTVTASNPNSTTLRATGTLLTGNQVYNTNSPVPLNNVIGRFTMLGNPFASPIDWTLLPKSDIENTYWGWDPNLNNTGGYVTISQIGGLAISSPFSGATGLTQHIQPGQGFFVRTSGAAPSLSIREQDKSSGFNRLAFRGQSGGIPLVAINLVYQVGPNTLLADGAVAAFDPSFSKAGGSEDAVKMMNTTETVAINNGNLLSIEGRPMPGNADTIYLNVTKLNRPVYKWQIFFKDIESTDLQAYLVDKYLNNRTPLSLTDTNFVSFAINPGVPASVDAERFQVVFKTAFVLASENAVLQVKKNENDVQLSWQASAEDNTSHFEVEHSTNGTNFKVVATVPVNSSPNKKYYWLDMNPQKGNNFYRIKVVKNNAATFYSNTVVARFDEQDSYVKLFPNPVSGQSMKVEFGAIAKGAYVIALVNGEGQKVQQWNVQHIGGSRSYEIRTNNVVPGGVYILRITDSENKLSFNKYILFAN